MKMKQTIERINYRNVFLFISWSVVIVFFLYCSINAVAVRDIETCKGVVFKINHTDDNYFIEEDDLKNELTTSKFSLIGKRMHDINFRKVERNVDKNVYVENAVMYKNAANEVVIEVEPKNPILRVCANNGMNYYVSDKWKIMPTSPKYTKHVLVLSGQVENILQHKNTNDSLLHVGIKRLTEFIVANEFWSGLIDQIHIEPGNKITLITGIMEPSIIFGNVDENMEKKFGKIEVFIKKCLPLIQQNNYQALDISFKNQVIGIKKPTINI